MGLRMPGACESSGQPTMQQRPTKAVRFRSTANAERSRPRSVSGSQRHRSLASDQARLVKQNLQLLHGFGVVVVDDLGDFVDPLKSPLEPIAFPFQGLLLRFKFSRVVISAVLSVAIFWTISLSSLERPVALSINVPIMRMCASPCLCGAHLLARIISARWHRATFPTTNDCRAAHAILCHAGCCCPVGA
jgi:hypothetical protein